jgi:hypothetical protein
VGDLRHLGQRDETFRVAACLTRADGHAERIAALHMIEPRADRPQAITVGADKAYDAEDFVNEPIILEYQRERLASGSAR